MKILFLTTETPDLLSDLLYDGLARTIGQDNIVDFPQKKWYHNPHYPYDVMKHGVLQACSYFEGHDCNHQQFTTQQIADQLRNDEYDFIICAETLPDVADAYLALRACLKSKLASYCFVVLDGFDDVKIHSFPLFGHPKSILFKREFDRDVIGTDSARFSLLQFRFEPDFGVRPLQFSCPYEKIPHFPSTSAKLHDVCMVWTSSTVIRNLIGSRVKEMPDIQSDQVLSPAGGHYAFTPRALDWEAYLSRYNASIAGLNIVSEPKYGDGFTGCDSLRYWEIPSLPDTLMISQHQWIEIPNNFTPDEVIFLKPDYSDLEEKIRWAKTHRIEAAEMARKAHETLLKYHTTTKRAEYLLREVQEWME